MLTRLSPLLELTNTNSELVPGGLVARQYPSESRFVMAVGGSTETRKGPREHLSVYASLHDAWT